ncbi:metallophosphoesterase [Leptospira sp. 201903071]|uniref:metallophosphoesterase n=1 Tax=Leptospira ainazelensis TaxID=2810034 RepID=UPI0019645BB1|nr:metallophosphoesterase [Leptospira ainazelensis]MBM9502214.1 metallophosphoesterase [Leptospira ainazelensis]
MENLKLALIGDIHGFWDRKDNEYFDNSDYDALLVTGDFPGYLPFSERKVTRGIADLKKKVYWIPGNHDSTNVVQLLGEILHSKWMIRTGSIGHRFRLTRLQRRMGDSICVGYSATDLDSKTVLIGARPFSMGGTLSFLPLLKKVYGVSSMKESFEKMKSLYPKIKGKECIILAHNGPAGYGSKRDDIWGCDFRKKGGDWGDGDLRRFLDFLKEREEKVSLVLAGHMHHRIKDLQRDRTWKISENSLHTINAAKVPRILKDKKGNFYRHHVRLERKNGVWDCKEIFVGEKGEEKISLPNEELLFSSDTF